MDNHWLHTYSALPCYKMVLSLFSESIPPPRAAPPGFGTAWFWNFVVFNFWTFLDHSQPSKDFLTTAGLLTMSGMVLGICRYQDSLPTRRNNFSWQHPSELQFTFLQKSANGWTITKKLNPNLKIYEISSVQFFLSLPLISGIGFNFPS